MDDWREAQQFTIYKLNF